MLQPEVNLRNPFRTVDEAHKQGNALALKPTGDVTRSPKQGYQWPTKRTYVLHVFKNSLGLNLIRKIFHWTEDLLFSEFSFNYYDNVIITRMHSSRMPTARLFSVSPSMHCSLGVYLDAGWCTWSLGGVPSLGVYLPRGCTWPKGYSAREGTWPGGCTCLGGYLPRGVYLPGGTCPGGVSAWGGTCPAGTK